MLITLCYVYMWVQFHKCYSVLIRNSLSRLKGSSFTFSFCSSSPSVPARATPAEVQADARRYLGSLPPEDIVFLQLGDKAVYLTDPQACDDLSKWTVPLGSSLICGPQIENISFIIEATESRVGCHSRHTSNKKVLKWSDYCLPLAYSPGQPFRVVAQSNVDNFIRLGVAFLEGCLQLDNGLLPSKIVPVVLKESTLSELVEKQCRQSPKTVTSQWLCCTQTKEGVVEPLPCNLLADHRHTQSHKGSLLLTPQAKRRTEERRGSEPLHGTQDIRLQALSHPWMDNTRLLVVAEEEALTPQLQTRFLTYLSQGGRVLGLTSTLCPAGLCLKFRERQRMVSRLNFIKEDSTELELSVLASGNFYVRDTLGGGEVELWGELKGEVAHQRDMVIVRITHEQDGGQAVLCQVHLEIAPENLTTESFDELKVSNALRYEVLMEILISLGLSCELNHDLTPTPIHLLAISLEAKAYFLKWLETQADQNGFLTLSKLSLRMVPCSELQDGSFLHEGSMDLITDSSESQSWSEFRMETYWKNLQTSLLGHTLFYTEMASSTMDLLEG
ncbi:unnamed protein product [Pleuronectes platessa]|uniref:Uncharacterized protein n=1 Tax=Pleuronectes platessa TaxID=8262 RepID=A0A9N7ZCZ8_PLEPL|nr:unnamed protein product [Pleuronectes platessa]